MLFLTACTSNNKPEQKMGDDGFPEFSQEQFQEMIKNNPQAQKHNAPAPQESTELMIQKMEAFLEKNPTDISTNYNLAKLYYQKYMQDDLATTCQKTISFYTKVIDLQADYEEGRPFYNRMLCYMNTDEYDAALSDLDRFIAINQDRTPVNYQSMRAEILFQKGNKEAACSAYKTALVRYEKDSLPIHNETLWNARCSD
jgi:tetratricopeptide (TPR) repeat protein